MYCRICERFLDADYEEDVCALCQMGLTDLDEEDLESEIDVVDYMTKRHGEEIMD